MGETVKAGAPDLYALAVAAAGTDPFARATQASRYAQPAIMAVGLTHYRAWEGRAPQILGGHSLGELTALAAGGAIDAGAALSLAFERGRLMDEAASAAGETGMLVILGSGVVDAVESIAAESDVAVANINAPRQAVLAGTTENLRRAAELAQVRGLATDMLPVAGAFHSPVMAPAVDGFRAALECVDVRSCAVEVWSGIHARPFRDVRQDLIDGLTAPVRWVDTVQAMHRAGATSFVELGPGRVLSNLVRRIVAGADAFAVESLVTM